MVDQIAMMVRSHSSIYDQWALDSRLRDEVEAYNIDPLTLYQRTFAEACVTYGDLADLLGERVDVTYKLDDAIKRYSGDLEPSIDATGNSLIIARPRLLALAKLVEQYSNGEVPPEKIRDHFTDLK